jgi:hypothetical protein
MAIKSIGVVMKIEEIETFKGQPVLIGNALCEKLKAAGVPVDSVIWPFKVKHGALSVMVDRLGIICNWAGEEEKLDEAKAPVVEDDCDLV